MQPFIILFIWLFSFSLMRTSNSVDTLALGQCIRDGETLISAGGTFEVGFFSPGTSTTNRYFGVWYRNVTPSTVVWVANRDTPLQHNSSGVIKLNENGVLQILNVTNSTLWSSNMSNKTVNDPIAQILESGNLVVKHAKDSNKDQFLWQGFDLPCDTLIIGGMKLGWDLVSSQEIFLSSWKSADDPAKGVYSANIDPRGYPQFVILEKSVMKYRIGSWNGLGFTGFPTHQLPQHYSFEFVLNEKHVYFECKIFDRSITSIYTLTPSGLGQISVWTSRTSSRKVISNGNEDECENYALCGSYSICNMDGNVVNCECLKGYVPKFPEQWNISYWSNGCVPRTKLDCNNSITDGFWRYKDIKLPDTSSSWFNKTMNLEECHKSCLKNSSCTAYASLDIRNGGSGCLLWFDNLIDMKQFSQWGQDLYIRVPASELVTGHRNMKKKLARIITCSLIIFGLTTCVSIMILRKKTAARIYNHVASFQWRQEYFRLGMEDMDLPTFDMSVLANATNNFSSRNKLGEGGFGAVYQGTLMDGQEVAIKRHSNNSDQGLEEFKNEVMVIAKLQHRNLVKLIGCCIEGEEKMLIYEYMPNKSLDYFIFDESRSKILDWCQRFHIIDGITRGLLYLHQDSRLRIIHRDLKTSNILLDAHMNPKISDFGLARIFGGDQSEAKTKKVVGTYGYMPPQYAVHGHYSMKSDVFSFGVIVLEIVSGKKNRGFSESENYYNLLGYAWRFWTEDRPLELIDENLGDRWISSEVIRCIHVGLLCVQQKPDDRPDMSSVVLMLNGEKLLPQPKGPGFCTGRCLPEAESSSRICNLLSPNEMSFTMFEAR